MTDYAVTIVWDVNAEDGPEEVEGAATAVSGGRLVTTYYVGAEFPLRAYDVAIASGRVALSGASPIGFAIEPASPTPHFLLGHMGR
ncbi:MAG: hypothetical protein HOY79_28945 [Streptomyces sp.]|nr:hypothetical protein [Streptomyces sp.]